MIGSPLGLTGNTFPWGTCLINVSGSLVLGILTSLTGALCNAATGVNCLRLLSF
jgi:fluoride ion exporter CrcB/FEX